MTVAVKHGTSSVFVFGRLGEGWRIGLIDHPRFGRLMLPGGHIEAEESPEQAALREVREETGLAARLVSPPVPPLPAGYQPPRVTAPWWIVEYQVPSDGHVTVPHVHIDYLYVAVAADPEPAGRAAHPFGWHAAKDLPGLSMFDDTRLLAAALLAGLAEDALGAAGPGETGDPRLALALLAGLGAAAGGLGV
jgi:8-oxo-dGTP pyrophosphatase MutT (NUDIX family)